MSRCPRARSKSSPGVRIVVVSGVVADADLEGLLDRDRVGAVDPGAAVDVEPRAADPRRDPAHAVIQTHGRARRVGDARAQRGCRLVGDVPA